MIASDEHLLGTYYLPEVGGNTCFFGGKKERQVWVHEDVERQKGN